VDGATGIVLDQVDEPGVHKSVIVTLVLGTVALVALKRRRSAEGVRERPRDAGDDEYDHQRED
jgi:hypothetical protein